MCWSITVESCIKWLGEQYNKKCLPGKWHFHPKHYFLTLNHTNLPQTGSFLLHIVIAPPWSTFLNLKVDYNLKITSIKSDTQWTMNMNTIRKLKHRLLIMCKCKNCLLLAELEPVSVLVLPRKPQLTYQKSEEMYWDANALLKCWTVVSGNQ